MSVWLDDNKKKGENNTNGEAVWVCICICRIGEDKTNGEKGFVAAVNAYHQ